MFVYAKARSSRNGHENLVFSRATHQQLPMFLRIVFSDKRGQVIESFMFSTKYMDILSYP